MAGTRPRLNLQAIAKLAEVADYTYAFAVRAISEIGVADHLAAGPKPIGELAGEAGCDGDALLRTMRALVSKGVFVEDPDAVFSLGPLGELLRSDHPLSMRGFFRMQPDVTALAGLEYSVRTGLPAFEHLYGEDYFVWLAGHDQEREEFRASQRSLNRLELLAILRAYRWADVRSIVDVGGNDGSFVGALLGRHPTMIGTVFDLPDTASKARKHFAEVGLVERTSVVPGDLFVDRVPAGADLYTIKRVLVGFSDDRAVAALRSIRTAMRADSRLLVMEPMRTSTDQVGVSLDVLMLVLDAGRTRTPEQFGALLGQAGLRAERTVDAGLITMVEAVPADR
jgi:hypothetical protein